MQNQYLYNVILIIRLLHSWNKLTQKWTTSLQQCFNRQITTLEFIIQRYNANWTFNFILQLILYHLYNLFATSAQINLLIGCWNWTRSWWVQRQARPACSRSAAIRRLTISVWRSTDHPTMVKPNLLDIHTDHPPFQPSQAITSLDFSRKPRIWTYVLVWNQSSFVVAFKGMCTMIGLVIEH